jgi:shikimate kinase
MNLLLIGYRCTGKTTIGRILAEKLAWPLVDTDALIQDRLGQTIDQFVAARGWDAFRDAETAVVKDVVASDQQVISLGGGAILREENRQALKSAGKLIYLRADPATIWSRLQSDPSSAAQRPNLTGQGGLEEITRLLAERRPIYDQSADFAISTDLFSPDEIAGRILAWLLIHRLV